VSQLLGLAERLSRQTIRKARSAKLQPAARLSADYRNRKTMIDKCTVFDTLEHE